MPASTPNKIGDVYGEMLELDVKAFINEESHYNKKKKKREQLQIRVRVENIN